MTAGIAQTPSTATPSPSQDIPAAAPASQQPSRPPYDPDQQKERIPSTAPSVPAPTPSATPEPPPGAPGKDYTAYPSYQPEEAPGKQSTDALGSSYIQVDSWVYPAMLRLYSMGFLDTAYIGLRPWTRRSAVHMLRESQYAIMNSGNDEAQGIYDKLLHEFEDEAPAGAANRGIVYGTHSLYTRALGITGPVLRDSFHLGQTMYNDYGRPFEKGFNNITGFSTLNEAGRFSLYIRGEYQHAPAGTGYSAALAESLSNRDYITPYAPPNRPQSTIPEGHLPAENNFRIIEASLSFHLLGHEISGGKSDAWLGPGQGGAFAWSNNAENIYSFRINRVEPLNIFLLSKLLGPVRYDFFYGSLKGHTWPNSPYAHSEMFSFRPTKNFEFGFQRTVIFGGKNHAPITLHTFLNGFFSLDDTTADIKFSREDPGARFSAFNFSYRLPFARKYATLYLDSICHDDVTPISAPRRSAIRPGIYISQFPGKLRPLDLRVEAVSTDPPTARSGGGQHNYWEVVQLQGYTNKGYIMGDWIGREAKGGNAWLTWHLSGNEWVQFSYMNKKTPKDFIIDGTTQNQFRVSAVKRFGPDVEMNAWVQYEGWKAPVYKTGKQSNTAIAFQMTWYPQLKHYPR
jgi:hypothetical protein